VRLHPLPDRTATAAGGGTDPGALAAAAAALSHAPLEAQSLDVRWGGGDGAVLARFGGTTARNQAQAAAKLIARSGVDATVIEDDEPVWQLQRTGQRSANGTVVRVSALQSQLAAVLAATTRLGGRLVGRAGLGLSWLRLEDRSAEDSARALDELRHELAPAACVVLDRPPEVGERVDAWGPVDPGARVLMQRVKERFDPAGILSPGVFVGGI
jgi:glycolate oxidase FAD binding subunit